jgi:hypothetical protein
MRFRPNSKLLRAELKDTFDPARAGPGVARKRSLADADVVFR